MSTMVSNMYPFNTTEFQTSNLFGRDMDFGYSVNAASNLTSVFDRMPAVNNASLTSVWPSQRPSNVPRRNSTSSVSSIAATRNKMNLNALSSASNVIPESTTTLSAAATILNTVAEERFRGRAYSEGASSLSGESQLPPQPPIASSRYKTELCRPFEENGKCKYGDKCQFAHGRQELRQLIRHPKYKTELCRTFHTSGICPYGPRCHFIHNQEDNVNRGSSAMQSMGSNSNLHRQAQHNTTFKNGMMSQTGVPIPVPNPRLSERNHFDPRPSRLNILAQQISAAPTFGSLSYSPTAQSPLGGSPTFYQDMSCSALMSPTSPNAGQNGSIFTFNNLTAGDRSTTLAAASLSSMMSGMPFDQRQPSPPLSSYDGFSTQGLLTETIISDDSAFDGPPTPPDSDRESMTGSPPSSRQQRLPIFRCLSQSD